MKTEKAAGSFDGTRTTSKQIKDVARGYLYRLEQRISAQPVAVLEAWQTILEPPFSGMTQAVRYDEGVVYVAVSNSSLLSLLHRVDEKSRLLEALRHKVPSISIRDIVFMPK